MGVSIRKRGDREVFVFLCDYPRCSHKSVRRMIQRQYDRHTGTSTEQKRNPLNSYRYWEKVLASGDKQMKFFLIGTELEKAQVYCADHREAGSTREPDDRQAARKDVYG